MTVQTTTGVIPELTLGQRLTVAMEYADKRPEDMALELRVSATTVRNWIQMRTKIDWAHLVLWSGVTGVDGYWLEHGHAAPPGGDGLEHQQRRKSQSTDFAGNVVGGEHRFRRGVPFVGRRAS